MFKWIPWLDTLKLHREDGQLVPVLNTGIAWPSDKQMKFRNPPNSNTNLSEGKVKGLCNVPPVVV